LRLISNASIKIDGGPFALKKCPRLETYTTGEKYSYLRVLKVE